MRTSIISKVSFLLALAFAKTALSQTANLSYQPIQKELAGRYSHGSHTQASWLMGKINLELIFGELYGRAVIGQRFQWNWKKNATYHGLTGGMMQLSELRKYPDLYNRFIALKPTYIRFTTPVTFSNDSLHGQYDMGHSKMEIELTEKDITAAVSDPYAMGAKKGFRYFSPEWHEFNNFIISKVKTQDLRYIGKKRKNSVSLNSKKSRAIDSEFSHTYSQTMKINPAALQVNEIRWPDVEMQNIFREFIRNEYKSFKSKRMTSRESLAQELNDDADSQTFWLGVNINLKKYETNSSLQDNSLARTLKAASKRQTRYTKSLNKMLERAKLDKSTFRSFMIKYFSDSTIFPTLVNTNIERDVEEHVFEMNGTLKASRSGLKRVNSVVNDILKFRAQRDGKYLESILLYNHGKNEVKLEIEYNDGMRLIHREIVERSGEKIPLRATLIWDFNNDRYEKSDIDIALSRKDRCKDDNLLVYHGERKHSDRASEIELDVDNKEGFGPENISIFDGGNYNYGYFCIKNYTNNVPAKVKVVVFENEVITTVGDEYVWEYEYDGDEKRRWKLLPGIYDMGGY